MPSGYARDVTSGNPERRLRVLVLAELCNPEWVSGPLVGYNHALALSQLVDVHIVTHTRNQEAFGRSSWPRSHLTCVDVGAFEHAQSWLRQDLFKVDHTTQMFTLLGIPFYLLYERLIWQRFGDEIRAKRFDIVHRITPVSPVVPSPMAHYCARSDVPFVLGPINGGLPWPKGYANAFHKEREWVSNVRALYKYAPFIPSTWRNSAALLVASRTTWEEIPVRYRNKCYYVPENGIFENTISQEPRERSGGPLRIVFVGRLVPLKCVDVAIRGAAPLIRDGLAVLDIVGDGPERSYLENVASEERIADKTTFYGWISSHQQTLEIVSSAHVLAFPSIREFGGGVVVEAMALGVVPIVMAYGGPAELVDASSGYRLPLASSKETEQQICTVLRDLASNRELWRTLSNGSMRRIREHFTWESKARMSHRIYRHLLGLAPRPELAVPAV